MFIITQVFLISTNALKSDFEKEERNLKEFAWSFKLEISIYENLNYIPFSFYRLPSSSFYSNKTNTWEFPNYQENSIKDYYSHLAINQKIEEKRLVDSNFNSKMEIELQRYMSEIENIENQRK